MTTTELVPPCQRSHSVAPITDEEEYQLLWGDIDKRGVQFATVTPKVAVRLLALNTHNRAISDEGQLLDGQIAAALLTIHRHHRRK